jgi:hypothetical protein
VSQHQYSEEQKKKKSIKHTYNIKNFESINLSEHKKLPYSYFLRKKWVEEPNVVAAPEEEQQRKKQGKTFFRILESCQMLSPPTRLDCFACHLHN